MNYPGNGYQSGGDTMQAGVLGENDFFAGEFHQYNNSKSFKIAKIQIYYTFNGVLGMEITYGNNQIVKGLGLKNEVFESKTIEFQQNEELIEIFGTYSGAIHKIHFGTTHHIYGPYGGKDDGNKLFKLSQKESVIRQIGFGYKGRLHRIVVGFYPAMALSYIQPNQAHILKYPNDFNQIYKQIKQNQSESEVSDITIPSSGIPNKDPSNPNNNYFNYQAHLYANLKMAVQPNTSATLCQNPNQGAEAGNMLKNIPQLSVPSVLFQIYNLPFTGGIQISFKNYPIFESPSKGGIPFNDMQNLTQRFPTFQNISIARIIAMISFDYIQGIIIKYHINLQNDPNYKSAKVMNQTRKYRFLLYRRKYCSDNNCNELGLIRIIHDNQKLLFIDFIYHPIPSYLKPLEVGFH